MLYRENLFVRVRSTHKNLGRLINLKGIPILLEGRKAETFKHCAMSVDLDRLNTPLGVKSQKENLCYIIASDDVQLLCQSFLIQHTVISGIFKHCQFKVTIHCMLDDMLSKNPAQTSPQRRLLEPFTLLHSVPRFKIAGPANTEYCASIAAQVSRMAPTVDEEFNNVIELRDKGHEHLGRDDLEGAVRFYRTAFSHLLSTCLRHKTVGTDWTKFYPGLPGAIMTMWLTLVANLTLLHCRLGEWEEAHIWACFATRYDPRQNLMKRGNFHAKLVYLKAMSSARLSKHPQAVEELCEGLKFVTKEAYKDKQLLAMRREVRFEVKGRGGIRLLKAMGFGFL